MRIFFIPGLGEEISIFDKIKPFIPGEKVFIENWTLLAYVPEKDITVLTYAKYLTERFQIKKEDILIGHSMGGWIVLGIKQIVGCRIIQIASWTDPRKIIKVPIERHLMYWLAKRGIGFNHLFLHIIVWLRFKNNPSREIFTKVFERMRTGNKEIVAKQLMVIFNPVKAFTVTPDLRIHAMGDFIVKYPDEDFHPVPGDHFTLYTYPETVYKPIIKFLEQQT
jgi:hypothetical protein